MIAQVERLADLGALKPRDVKVPGLLVDRVVVARPEHRWQTVGTCYCAGFSGEMRIPGTDNAQLPLDERKIIARRAALELKANSVVKLGISDSCFQGRSASRLHPIWLHFSDGSVAPHERMARGSRCDGCCVTPRKGFHRVCCKRVANLNCRALPRCSEPLEARFKELVHESH